MTLHESIKAVREAWGNLISDTWHRGGVGTEDNVFAMNKRLTAAESAAAAQDGAYQRAREAWFNGGGAVWLDDRATLDEYFKGGE